MIHVMHALYRSISNLSIAAVIQGGAKKPPTFHFSKKIQ